MHEDGMVITCRNCGSEFERGTGVEFDIELQSGLQLRFELCRECGKELAVELANDIQAGKRRHSDG